VFRSDFVGGRLTRNVISAAELDAKIAGAARGAPGPAAGRRACLLGVADRDARAPPPCPCSRVQQPCAACAAPI